MVGLAVRGCVCGDAARSGDVSVEMRPGPGDASVWEMRPDPVMCLWKCGPVR